MKELVSSILQHVYNKREFLSKNKFSGVHEASDNYAIHKSDLFPKFILAASTDNVLDAIIMDSIEESFSDETEFDPESQWLYIHKGN